MTAPLISSLVAYMIEDQRGLPIAEHVLWLRRNPWIPLAQLFAKDVSPRQRGPVGVVAHLEAQVTLDCRHRYPQRRRGFIIRQAQQEGQQETDRQRKHQ